MGLIADVLGPLLGSGRNAIRETVEVFRPNAEAADMREAAHAAASLAQFATEFSQPRQGPFDRFMDGLNRLPRPMLALGTLGLFVAAMTDPVWFAQRMQGIALVPDPLWWLMGAIVSFYFGARHQIKAQDFQRGLATTLARAPEVAANIRVLAALSDKSAGDDADDMPDAGDPPVGAWRDNAALDEWSRLRGQ